MQAGRSRPGGKEKQLASVNFPIDLLAFLDTTADELGTNRSSLVVFILQEFKDSGRMIKMQILEKE